MTSARLDELVQRYVDRRLPTDEREELERELLASPAARQHFWRILQFEGLIQEIVDAQQVRSWMTDGERETVDLVEESAANRRQARKRRVWFFVPVGIAAALVLAFMLLRSNPPPIDSEPTSRGVAILSGSVGVRWNADQVPIEPGSIMTPGRIQINSGLIGIEFYGGARVTLQGPADIDVRGVDHLVCRQGKLRIHVSERARGFKVSSPKLELIDLGAEFGVDIVSDSHTELHVFSGNVALAELRVADGNRLPRELAAGEGLRIDGTGVTAIAAQPVGFAGQLELSARLQEQTLGRYASWRDASTALRSDPRLVLYYDFQSVNPTERILPNRSFVHGEALDGTVVGADWAQGRWSGKSALEFRQPSDRVRIFVPGEFDAMTLITWLRVDSFDTAFSGILLTDGFVKGTLHWQFYQGRIRLGIGGDKRPDGRIGTEYDVDTVEPAALIGHWRQLAVVVDMNRREVVHFLDGRPVKRATIQKPHPLSLGKAELGKWGLPDGRSPPIRNFSGRMDEFMLFNQALTEAEIAALFERGRPRPSQLAAAVR
jgi:hypothetical protein